MVVDDIEEDGDTEGVRLVHQPAQVVGRAVAASRCEQIDAVISPVPGAREVGHRHQFNRRDSESSQVRQPL